MSDKWLYEVLLTVFPHLVVEDPNAPRWVLRYLSGNEEWRWRDRHHEGVLGQRVLDNIAELFIRDHFERSLPRAATLVSCVVNQSREYFVRMEGFPNEGCYKSQTEALARFWWYFANQKLQAAHEAEKARKRREAAEGRRRDEALILVQQKYVKSPKAKPTPKTKPLAKANKSKARGRGRSRKGSGG